MAPADPAMNQSVTFVRTPAEPVTVTVSRAVRRGREQEFERWAEGVFAVAARFPGYLGSSLLRPGRDPRDDHVVYRFADDETLRGWHDSPERADWLAGAEDLVDDQRDTHTQRIEHSFERTEGAGSPPPPRWKMGMFTLCSHLSH